MKNVTACRFCGQDVSDLGEHWKLGGDCAAVAAALNPVRLRSRALICDCGSREGVTKRWHKCTKCRQAYWRAKWRERYYVGDRSDRDDAAGHRRT